MSDDIVLVTLEGEVGLEEIGRLTVFLENCFAGSLKQIVINLKDAGHIHYRFTMLLGPAIKLAGVNDYHQKILDAMGAGRDLERYGSVAQALLSCCDSQPGH